MAISTFGKIKCMFETDEHNQYNYSYNYINFITIYKFKHLKITWFDKLQETVFFFKSLP